MNFICLPPNQIHLWFCHYGESGSMALDDLYRSLLTREELLLHERFRFARDRHRYLVTRVLVRWVLSRYTQVPASAWQFAADQFGRPRIDGPMLDEVRGLDFNVSHTKGLIVLGVGRDIKFGVDVENTSGSAALDIVDHAFSSEEACSLRSLSADKQEQRFFEIWTLKESLVKACGLGLQMDFGRFSFDLDGDDINLVFADNAATLGRNWLFWQFQPSMDYVVAVCAAPSGASTQIICREALPLRWERDFDISPARATIALRR